VQESEGDHENCGMASFGGATMGVMMANPAMTQINWQRNPLIETQALIPIIMNLE
jgi:hypothetical protein